MNYLRGAVSAISAPYQYYKDINPSTLTGAIDVIVIRRPSDDGDVVLACSPFHVRFGKLQVLRPAEKKVNVSVNGNPIPFSMKIGDAGDAFFVFETEEDIPEDLVTSPILTATKTATHDEIPSVTLSKTPEVPPAAPKMPEPEFLDLNATLHDRVSTLRKRGQSYSAPQTPPLEVDFPQAPVVSPPSIQYTDDMALDMAGYHSPTPDKSKFVPSESQNQVTSTSTSTDKRIPFPPSRPSVPSHLQTSFPARRAVSESPDDLTAEGGSTSLQVQEYSWEWGSFPQPSPLQPHFTPPVLKGNGDDTRPEVDEDELILKRSHSVPPELEGSPHTIRSPLPLADDHDDQPPSPHVYQEPGEYKDEKPFGSNGRITARHDDQTKFQVWIDGTMDEFELSLVASRDALQIRDEAQVVFEQGIIDYAQLMADENLVRDERLVMRWTGKLYITREERSPLMDALQLWASTAREDFLTAFPSPPSSPSSPPLRTDTELRSPSDEHEGPKRSDSEPPGVSTPKSAPSSWVRWWSRSRDIPPSERPVLREASTISFDQKLGKPAHVPSHLPHPSASAPATTPVAFPSPTIQPIPDTVTTRKVKKFAKTLRLSSDQLKSLNLKPGANTITFSLSTTGAPGCASRIFLLDSTDHVVVSDIDGTITKSDGLGHIFTMIGRDWTHLGVAKLYSDITRNGYKIMYLTSRAIGQADSTREYLKGVKQNDYQLPEGPVIMSPDRLMASLHREVIMRKPEVFKMACLRDIQRLFGEGPRTPFYAGFGNRITDALSYRSVNIPSARIFTIDPSGEVKMELLELAGYKSSYIHMTDLVDQMFPPINRKWAPDYTDFNYWRPPMQEFPLPDLVPPSPALSARSDTSSQSALARLRNFSLVGSRQPILSKPTLLPAEVVHGGLDGGGHRSSHLRQMSSFERLGSRLVALTQSSSNGVDDGSGSGTFPSRSSVSASSTYLDSEDEGDVGEDGELKKQRRTRSMSMSSMPGSLDDMHFGLEDDEGEGNEGGEEGGEGGYIYDGENEEVAAEEAFDEDFLATGEMQNVPFL
ncbi:Lipin/Ned1/Smp2-domain-containing protein [Butyriboletus roseoflavus]|nr:Lipin/Ned1/Smp2-domain-containing protein [Butyriboletus roseoflavus]